jgi:hypothetical protein
VRFQKYLAVSIVILSFDTRECLSFPAHDLGPFWARKLFKRYVQALALGIGDYIYIPERYRVQGICRTESSS